MTAESGLEHMPGSEGAPEAANVPTDVSWYNYLGIYY